MFNFIFNKDMQQIIKNKYLWVLLPHLITHVNKDIQREHIHVNCTYRKVPTTFSASQKTFSPHAHTRNVTNVLFHHQRLILLVVDHACVSAKSLQSCPTLCDPMDCSPPSFSVHGILQAIVMVGCHASSRGSSRLKDQTQAS